jgi:hypothetical protein
MLVLKANTRAEQFKLKNGQIIQGNLLKYSDKIFKVKDDSGKILSISRNQLLSIVFEEITTPATPLTISTIKTNKNKFLGQIVVLKGQYQGWLAEAGPPPVTRSDWVLKDSTGLIYVTGKLPCLDPNKNRGSLVEVTGTVESNAKEQIYIKSTKISCLKCAQ